MTPDSPAGRSNPSPEVMERRPFTVIWDGECGFCGRCMNLLQRMDRNRRFVYLTCQSPERASRFPQVARAQCLEALQLVAPDGSLRGGPDAVQAICGMLPWPWKLVPWIYRIPGVPPLAGRAYKWVAAHRVLLGQWTYPFLKRVPRGPDPNG